MALPSSAACSQSVKPLPNPPPQPPLGMVETTQTPTPTSLHSSVPIFATPTRQHHLVFLIMHQHPSPHPTPPHPIQPPTTRICSCSSPCRATVSLRDWFNLNPTTPNPTTPRPQLDGQALSSRLEQLMPLGSLIFKEDSGYKTFYYHLMRWAGAGRRGRGRGRGVWHAHGVDPVPNVLSSLLCLQHTHTGRTSTTCLCGRRAGGRRTCWRRCSGRRATTKR